MKKSVFFESFKMLLVIVVCSLLGTDVSLATGGAPLGETGASDVAASGVSGVAGAGIHLPGETMDIETVRREADNILVSEIDKVVTKIHPYKTPLDQIMRFAQQRTYKSMKIEWVSVDTKPFTTEVASAGGWSKPGTPSTSNSVDATIVVEDSSVFAKSSTILIPSILGFENGVQSTDTPLMVYVKSKSGSTLIVRAANGGPIASSKLMYVPSIPAGTELFRQGRAAYEKDVQTEASSTYPTTEDNYMQAFICQVEQSFWYKDSAKLIDWTLEDQKEMAILEWKMEIEATQLNGVKSIIFDDSDGKGEVYTSNGLLRYIKKSYEYSYNGWDTKDFTGITKAAFTGNSGSPRRVLLMGSDLMESMMNVDLTLIKGMDRGAEMHWGIEFSTIKTNFGRLLCLHWELLDIQGMADQGILIDPNQLAKGIFKTEDSLHLNNREIGISNTEADITTEISCMIVKYPQAHLRVKRGAAVLPIANAGSDITVAEGGAVALDGSGSTKGSGTTLTYLWTPPTGITLSNTASDKPTFTAPAVEADTDYTISLVVNDGISSSVADTVKVTVTATT